MMIDRFIERLEKLLGYLREIEEGKIAYTGLAEKLVREQGIGARQLEKAIKIGVEKSLSNYLQKIRRGEDVEVYIELAERLIEEFNLGETGLKREIEEALEEAGLGRSTYYKNGGIKMKGVPGMVSKIVDKYQGDRDMLIQILLDLQSGFGWLPGEVLTGLSKQLGVPLIRVYQIATYYKAFSLVPKGRHLIRVCMGTACQVRGSPLIRDRMEQLLGIKPGETTPDMEFSLETVNCLGCCAMGPMAEINGVAHGPLTVSNVGEILEKYR